MRVPISISRQVIALVFLLSINIVSSQPNVKRVLLLHQSGINRPFPLAFDRPFAEAMRSSGNPQIDLYAETIETERFPEAGQVQWAADYLARKYANRRMDVIVTIGDSALRFARQYREKFGDPPIVSIATGGQIRAADDKVTGLEIDPTYGWTIDLAVMLLPDTRTVYVVDGARNNAGTREADFRRQFQQRDRGVRLVYLRDLPLTDLLRRLSEVPDHSVVMYLNQTMVDDSQDIDQAEGLAQVVRASPAPVFGFSEQFLGHGIVGGYLWQMDALAKQTAAMAIGIANGASARDLPVGRAPQTNILDWRELERWKIPASRVPAGATVLFRPPSFFERYRNYVALGLAIFGVQLALIVGLVVERAWRRRAEDEAQRTRDRLAQVTRLSAMGELAASLAHELHKPLSSILFNARAGTKLLAGKQESPGEIQEILKEIAEEDQRASDILTRMRELVSKRVTERIPVNVNDVVRSVLKLARRDLANGEVSLDTNLAAEPLMVAGDSVQLQQVILNLLFNAIEATAKNIPGSRKVSIDTESADDERVHVTVRDNGPGLKAGSEREIFEPFHTTKPSGLGMGLSIARSIVEAHDGVIWALSSSPAGAEFHFTLPRIEPPAQPASD